MPPKKDTSAGNSGAVSLDSTGLKGFDNKETRLLAAMFIASTGPGKVPLPLTRVLFTAR